MKLADIVEKGLKSTPPRILTYGIHGIGKSTWAAHAAHPVFVQTDD